MRILEKIISELPIEEECKYSINTDLLLKKFLDYEEDVPKEFYERCNKKGLIGSAIDYLQSIDGFELLEEGNSYNWGGRISRDFHYMMANIDDSFYIAMQINRYGEVRCHSYDSTHNNSYTDPFLLKLESYQDFYDLLDEIAIEDATSAIEVDGKYYLVTPQIQSELLQVKDMESGEEVFGIWASNHEEFTNQVRDTNHRKKAILVLKKYN